MSETLFGYPVIIHEPLKFSKPEVHIRVTRLYGGYHKFEWLGPADGIASASYEVLEMKPMLLRRLPWKVKVIANDSFSRLIYFRRKHV